MKTLFWDTSALVALVFQETHTLACQDAWAQGDAHYAWRWLAVEASAALSRRRADAGAWKVLDKMLDAASLVDLEPQEVPALCRINREWGLRAADAGHLYVYSRMTRVFPDIKLISCDEDMLAAARTMRYSIWEKGRKRSALYR